MGRRARDGSPGSRRGPPPADPHAAVDRILADPRVRWIPVRHHSPGCALHVERLLRDLRPAAVLVEGPEDADHLVQWLVHPESEPPLVVLLAFNDPESEEPRRVRVSWPLLRFDPEWVALRVGAELGAEVRLIDAPIRAIHEGQGPPSDDRALAESAYFLQIAARSGRTSFDGWWESTFEAAAAHTATDAFFRALLVFAWCARNLGDQAGAVSDSIALREGHLRWHVDQALARHPEGTFAVVTGAFHAVALPDVRPKRVKAKADRTASVLVSAVSDGTAARLGVSWPGWLGGRLEALQAGRPTSGVAEQVLVAIAREARGAGLPVGTADAVGAVEVALGLAKLRGGGGLAVEDLLDAVRSAFVKGAIREVGDPVLATAERVLRGATRGRLPDEAGRPPLVEDFVAELRVHRIELGDDVREVRCDVEKQEKHRAKSAFLHRCALLGIPMFGELPDADGEHFRGPDLVEKADLHLSIERWGVVRTDDLDDTLLQLTDRGPTVATAALSVLDEQRAEAGDDASRCARVLLEAARTRSTEILPQLLSALGGAVARDDVFEHLVDALDDLVLLHRYRDALPTRGDVELHRLILATYERACLVLPTVRHSDDETAIDRVDRLVALVRFALTEAGADRRLLVDRLGEVGSDLEGQPLIRGAAHGLLSTVGATTPRAVGAELHAHLRGPLSEVRRGGAFLEGVLRTSRSTFLASPRLLEAVHEVLGRLPEEEFLVVLPDLRRAFSVFVPAELERIGERVGELLVLGAPPDPDTVLSPSAAAVAREVDARIGAGLRIWFGTGAGAGGDSQG